MSMKILMVAMPALWAMCLGADATAAVGNAQPATTTQTTEKGTYKSMSNKTWKGTPVDRLVRAG
jgi:hypothetical protein